MFIPAYLSKLIYGTVIIDEWWEWFGEGGIASDIKKGFLQKLRAKYDNVAEIALKSKFDGIIAIANGLKKRLRDSSNCVVLHGATEFGEMRPYPIGEARKLLNLSPDNIILGMSKVTGGDHKENEPFFKAFGKLSEKYPQLKLLVSGTPSYIKNYLSPLLGRNLIDIGWQTFDKYNLYLCACNVFVLPFSNIPRNIGRWPNKFGDYLALNRPIITNDTGDISHYLKNFKIGFLCENTSEDYMDLIEKYILNNKYNLVEFEFKDVCEQLYNFPRRTEAILDFYKITKQKKAK
jgi:glycosyltransferase involved in cell wall biosynthesis